MTEIFIPTEYYELYHKPTTPYHDKCVRNELKRKNAIIVEELKIDNKKLCIYKMNDFETCYDRISRLENYIKNQDIRLSSLEARMNTVEKKNEEIYMNHILGQCISVYLLKMINRLEKDTNFENWYDIPDEKLKKYGFSKDELNNLKRPRNVQCHPYITKNDIIDMLKHFTFSENFEKIRKLVLFIYNPETKTFK